MRQVLVYALGVGLMGMACGDGTTEPPPGPPPPPPPPPPTVPPPATTVTLNPGESVILDDAAEIRSFEIDPGGSGEYVVVVHSASQVASASTPVNLSLTASTASLSSSLSAPGTARAQVPEPIREIARPAGWGRSRELALRQAFRDELLRSGARPVADAGTRTMASRLSGARPVPSVGDMLDFNSSLTAGGQANCTAMSEITGEVKAVGQHFVIVEDTTVAGHFTQADFDQLIIEIDDFIFPVDSAYFGLPADLDDNQRVIALFTSEVNQLNPEGSEGLIIGFFNPLDLADPATCAGSNNGEIIYLIGPDPDGDFGEDVTVEVVKRLARGLVAHEVQHLINEERRSVIGNAPLGNGEHAWLDEGLSHVAEEVAGFHRRGHETRQNFDLGDITATQQEGQDFIDFHVGNFLNAQSYLEDPVAFQALEVSPSDAGFDVRGFGYLFLRWLADRYAPATPQGLVGGSAEEQLFRQLVGGGPNHLSGPANIVRAVNAVTGQQFTWEEIVAEYMAAPAADDRPNSASLPVETQFRTWNMRQLFDQLQASNLGQFFPAGFPLASDAVTAQPTTNSSFNFDLPSGTGRYLELVNPGNGPAITISMTTNTGADLPAGARVQITVLRVQ